ncbi:MAG: cell division protein ZapA [Gammaproteobacteria bacterium]
MSERGTVEGVSIHILDKEYLVACPEDERQDLLASADYLDKKMREIRDSGKVVGQDRLAVMAALNIAHELLSRDTGNAQNNRELNLRLQGLQEKIEDALLKNRQLEL